MAVATLLRSSVDVRRDGCDGVSRDTLSDSGGGGKIMSCAQSHSAKLRHKYMHTQWRVRTATVGRSRGDKNPRSYQAWVQTAGQKGRNQG